MKVDLHIHSIYSDGWYTPDEICRRAKARGLSALSITDHDTLAGEEEKRAAAKKYGLRYVTGWEISAYDQNNKMHILGYGCACNEQYFSFMEERKADALKRAEFCVEKLGEQGIPLTLEEVLAERSAPDLPVHTMHVARALGKRLQLSETEAYAQYLGYGKPASPVVCRPTPKEAIDCIHALGGVAVLAHPGRIFLDPLAKENTVRALAKAGLDGIEGYYTTHTAMETAYFCRLADELSLLVTGGSDTHVEEETHTLGQPTFTPSEGLLERLGAL